MGDLTKGMIVEVFPHGNTLLEPEGVATLIERVEDTKECEKWMVKFKGEHRLFKRVFKKSTSSPSVGSGKMIKRIKSGSVKYHYPPGKQPRKKKTILGLSRTTHSEFKFEYKKSRKK